MLRFDSGEDFAMGRARFLDYLPDDPEATPKIYVKVILRPLEFPVLAQLDTGAPWLFFDRELLEAVGVRGDGGPSVRISTRFGPKAGRLERFVPRSILSGISFISAARAPERCIATVRGATLRGGRAP